MKKMCFLFFAAAALLTAADALAQASYVRKRLEPKFFMPEDAKVQPEKLPMPRYTKGAETTIKEANYRDSEKEEEPAEIYDSAVEDEAETDDSMPLYQQKYDDYSRDLEHINNTGQIPENRTLNEDLGAMDSERRVTVAKKPYQVREVKAKFDKALEESLNSN